MATDIYQYTDYRKFLRDYYEKRKKKDKSFSYQRFAGCAGFKTKTFLFNVVKGGKPLSKNRIINLALAMGLNKKETDYFETLVNFNQAKTVKEKDYYYHKLQSGSGKSRTAMLRTSQHEFYSRWYHLAVRELLNILDFRGDFKALAKSVDPPISVSQAKKSVQLLKELGLVEKLASGRYRQTDKVMTTGDEVVSLAVQKYHKENLAMALESIDRHTRDERDISCITCSVSGKGFEKIKSEIQLFRKVLLELIEQDKPADRVCQINFQLFPISNVNKKRG